MDYRQGRRQRIDLHIHSTASDGTLSPGEILCRALSLELRAIAITDHDTAEGCRTAIRQGIPGSLDFITGIEISASPPAPFAVSGSFHILGYGMDIDHPGLNDILEKQQAARKNRNPLIIKRLTDLGIPLRLEEIESAFKGAQLGRPHIAQILLEKGYVRSIDEAFDLYIGKGRPAYVEKFRLSCGAAINAISRAGGVAVLAHPAILKIDHRNVLEGLVSRLKTMGLKGIEVYYPEHTPEQTAFYIDLAQRNRLLMTGGTDFHGGINPHVEMGSGAGNFHVPYEVYESLSAAISIPVVPAAGPSH